MKIRFLILAGDGINCERETAAAFEHAGAFASIIHVNDLLKKPSLLRDFSGMALPGGFSFGDELGSGQVMALKLKFGMRDELMRFVSSSKPIIGICNGFQILVKLGLLPMGNGEKIIGLEHNKKECFISDFTELTVQKKICKWTSLLPDILSLPIRHGEGRVVFSSSVSASDYHDHLKQKGQIVFVYNDDVNGSYERIAGICDPSGMILGMMPHPEACVFAATEQGDRPPLSKGVGYFLFKSMIDYLEEL